MNDEGGLDALSALGARSVPVVARGDDFVFGQVIKDVVAFLDLPDDTAPELSPDELLTRYDGFLETAIRLTRQMPDDKLSNELPDRPRSWLVLLHHVFQIPTAYLDMEETGETLSYDNMVAPPPDGMQTSADIADFGETVRSRFNDWAKKSAGGDFTGDVPTYFGGTSRHEMLERTVWHSAQHMRQVAALLEEAGVTPERPLTASDISGLPLTDKVWG